MNHKSKAGFSVLTFQRSTNNPFRVHMFVTCRQHGQGVSAISQSRALSAHSKERLVRKATIVFIHHSVHTTAHGQPGTSPGLSSNQVERCCLFFSFTCFSFLFFPLLCFAFLFHTTAQTQDRLLYLGFILGGPGAAVNGDSHVLQQPPHVPLPLPPPAQPHILSLMCYV